MITLDMQDTDIEVLQAAADADGIKLEDYLIGKIQTNIITWILARQRKVAVQEAQSAAIQLTRADLLSRIARKPNV